MDYKKAGVDIEAGYRSVELMKEHVTGDDASRSFTEDLEDFPEHFLLRSSKNMEEPALVSGTDGCRNKAEAGVYLG